MEKPNKCYLSPDTGLYVCLIGGKPWRRTGCKGYVRSDEKPNPGKCCFCVNTVVPNKFGCNNYTLKTETSTTSEARVAD